MSAEKNRSDFPEFAKVVDEFRRVFGPIKVKWVRENGRELGNVPKEISDAVS